METSERMRGALWAAARVLALAALAGACGGTKATSPIVGSESHFLAHCATTCADGLDCIGGICTRACLTSASDCSDLDANASCTDQSVEPGEVAVCDVRCSGTADCERLGGDYSCEGAFCRANAIASVQPSEPPGPGRDELCQPYLDQTPPPDVRGLSIFNEGTQVLYLQEFWVCTAEAGNGPSLVQVARDGQPVNTLGACATSCERAFEQGWNAQYDGEGRTVVDCPELDCSAPVFHVPIQPGETLFQPARQEIVFQRMPGTCAQGSVTDAVNCFSRVIPPRGNYTLTVWAFAEPRCDENMNCPAPFVYSLPSEWPFENQTLNIAAPILLD